MGWWSSVTNAFTRDGVVTRFTEKIPVVGLVTAGVQAISGNGEHAKRALANQANAVITTAGTVGGFVVGGPVGAAAGGALASSVGIVAEYGVSTTINDKDVKGDTGDLSLTRFGTDAVLGGAGGLIGGGGAGAAVKQVGMGFSKEAAKQVGKQATGSIIKAAGGALLTQGAKGINEGLKNPNVSEPQKEDPPKEENPDLVRAVSEVQAEYARNWMRAVRKLEDFPKGVFYNCQVDGRNLDPGSNVTNITRNLDNLPRWLHENIEYAPALNVLESNFQSVTSKLTGAGSKGMNLRDALHDKIMAQMELQALEKEEMVRMLDVYVADIQARMVSTRTRWAAEVYMIQRSQIRAPNMDEFDL